MKFLRFTALALAVFFTVGPLKAGDIVQIDISDTFNTRSISTVVNGLFVPQSGNVDDTGGLSTKSAAVAAPTSNGEEDPHALPDDGKFPATDKHPEIVLSYGNDDGRKALARQSQGDDTYVIDVPEGNYIKLFLVLTSGHGSSDVGLDLKYSDKSIETRDLQIPDWLTELKPSDKFLCYVATDLSKWNSRKMLAKDHHSIFAIDIEPNTAKILQKIRVRKTGGGILTVFGAVGQMKPDESKDASK